MTYSDYLSAQTLVLAVLLGLQDELPPAVRDEVLEDAVGVLELVAEALLEVEANPRPPRCASAS